MEFEWDEAKRLSNLVKHDIDFLDARRIFDNRPVIEIRSSYPDEERWLTTGFLFERLTTVVWTPRGNVAHIISVRRARDEEERRYSALHGRRD